jgi:hypothetical protein
MTAGVCTLASMRRHPQWEIIEVPYRYRRRVAIACMGSCGGGDGRVRFTIRKISVHNHERPRLSIVQYSSDDGYLTPNSYNGSPGCSGSARNCRANAGLAMVMAPL